MMPNLENAAPIPTGFGERVLSALERADGGWSLRSLSARLGVGRSAFYRWLYGDTEPDPGIGVYVRLALVLGCTDVLGDL